MHALTVSVLAMLLSLTGQVQKMEPDSPKFMNGEFGDWSGKVFAVDSYDMGPIGIVEVEEVKQQKPRSRWGV
jgi:hypothetical protein